MRIYNAQIKTMKNDREIEKGYVTIENGRITEVGEGEISPESGDFDAKGRLLIPGFIDAHTHLGILENGLGFEGDDVNESTDPFTPQLRAIDGINPFDRAFEEARERGITTVAVSPGSANACGGTIIAMKTAGTWVDKMAVRSVAMKFALGENPKTCYSEKNETPMTRMGTVSLIREGLYKAKRYLDDIQEAAEDEGDMPEYDAKSEALLPLLKREITAHFHCHRADDIQTAIRIAREFHLKCVIIHGTDSRKIADGLAEYKVPVVVGPVISERCKPELAGHEVTTCGVLWKKGVKIAICTDHDVVPIYYLPLEAKIAVKNGLPYSAALRAITADAAEILGISDRCGAIAEGLDADLQLYSCEPLGLDSPDEVWVRGRRIEK